MAGARTVASRRWARRGSSRTEFREGKGVSPGDTVGAPTTEFNCVTGVGIPVRE